MKFNTNPNNQPDDDNEVLNNVDVTRDTDTGEEAKLWMRWQTHIIGVSDQHTTQDLIKGRLPEELEEDLNVFAELMVRRFPHKKAGDPYGAQWFTRIHDKNPYNYADNHTTTALKIAEESYRKDGITKG